MNYKKFGFGVLICAAWSTIECSAIKNKADKSMESKKTEQKKVASEKRGPLDIKNKKDFDTILKDNNLVIAKFHSPACPHCVRMAPIFEEIALKYPEIKFVSVSAFDKGDQILFDDYKVDSYPTFAFFKNGKIYFKQIGGSEKKDFESNVKKLQGK